MTNKFSDRVERYMKISNYLHNKEYIPFSPMDTWLNEAKETNPEKELKKLLNESLDNFERLKAMFLMEFFMAEYNEMGWFKDEFLQEEKDYAEGRRVGEFFGANMISTQIANFFVNGKRFKLNEEVIELLSHTDSNIEVKPLPHSILLFDIYIKNIIFNIDLWGILVQKIYHPTSFEKGINFSAFGRDYNDNSNFYQHNTIWYKSESDNRFWYKNEIFSVEQNMQLEFKIKHLICNILDFINLPEVEIIEKDNSYLNENRRKKGRFNIPNLLEINLTGKLKRYIYNDIPKQKLENNDLSQRRWIRGHFRNFRSEKYVNMKNHKIWIYPYLKGSVGEPINTTYSLGKAEEWKKQKLMISIVKEIYYDKKCIKNCRTILGEGLEIDCYLPTEKIGFEYNGYQHTIYPNIFHKTEEEFLEQQLRDKRKIELAKQKGIKLIIINFTEDVTKENIIKFIKNEDGL